jgi:alanyl-tRNA synthetase
MNSDHLRELFLAYFEGKAHKRLPSAGLIPIGDPSLLVINAGMAPLKPYFEGREKPPAPRAASCQKCIRTVDIDKVGLTARHLTFFEMLGNFSFGDYFKEGAIELAWDFLMNHAKLDPARLTLTTHEKDEVSPNLWEKVTGFPRSRIFGMGDKDNLWAAGDIGPWGYDSEIFVDMHPERPFDGTRAMFEREIENDRFLEIWNLVFMEYFRDAAGGVSNLPRQNVDTGMGLERLAAVVQGVDSMFKTDLLAPLTDAVANTMGMRKDKGVGYDNVGVGPSGANDVYRVADHIRSATFLITDGAVPTNEGLGYVVRKLIRRIVTALYLHKVRKPVLASIAASLVAKMRDAYPELDARKDTTLAAIGREEQSFLALLDRHLDSFMAEVEKAKAAKTRIPAETVFRFYDTYGFPVELAAELAAPHGASWDESEFEALMNAQKGRARKAAVFATSFGTGDPTASLPTAEFVRFGDDGGNRYEIESKIIAAVPLVDAKMLVFVPERTVFYSEGGGQPGDIGAAVVDGREFAVTDTKNDGQHFVQLTDAAQAALKPGATVILRIDADRRKAITRAHTATHLLHKALRTVLGTHVVQSGSQLYPDRTRFDFSHFKAMTADEKREVERLINQWILESHPVTTVEMPFDAAKAEGVMALFGEKYGDVVRVLRVGNVSVELCGGTHLSNSAQAGTFVLVKEESVQSGIRRIEATTGLESVNLLLGNHRLADDIIRFFNVPPHEVRPRIDGLVEENRRLHEEYLKARREVILADALAWLDQAESLGNLKILARETKGLGRENLKFIADRLMERIREGVVALTEDTGGVAAWVVKCSPKAVAKGMKAGEIVRLAAKITGGGGGGRDDFAEAGGKDPSKIAEALASVREHCRSKASA